MYDFRPCLEELSYFLCDREFVTSCHGLYEDFYASNITYHR